jgi:hypothetical protein
MIIFYMEIYKLIIQIINCLELILNLIWCNLGKNRLVYYQLLFHQTCYKNKELFESSIKVN